MSYFGVSLRNGVGLGLGTVPSLTNTPLSYRLAPSLDLSFAGSDTLSPLITFSRTTSATVTNSAGLVAGAPMNLLTFSEQFDNAVWTKSPLGVGIAPVVTANAAVAPDGTTTADLVVLNKNGGSSSGDWSWLYQNFALPVVNAPYTFSVWVKAATAGDVGKVVLLTSVGQDLFTLTAAWQRVSTTLTTPSNATISSGVRLRGGEGTANSASFYIWGAQLELGSTATTYNPTTVKNLLGFTEHFDNAAWTKSNAFVQTNLLTYSQMFGGSWSSNAGDTVTGNAATAPDGTNTATLVALTTGFTNLRALSAIPITAGATLTASMYVKAGTGSQFQVMILYGASGSYRAWLNTTTGAISGGALSGTYSNGSMIVVDAGNGWWRVAVTVTTATDTAVLWETDQATASGGYSAVAGSSFYCWGAQLVQGTSAGDYKATYAAAAAVGYTDIYGQPFAQKLVENTATVQHFCRQDVATTAGPYVLSFYAKAAERSVAWATLDGGSNTRWFNLSTGTTGGALGSSSITDVGGGWYRCSYTFTRAAGTAPCFIGLSNANNAAGYTGDGTSGIYIFGAQLSDSASVDPYVYQPVAAPSSVVYYGPRFDYDPVTLAPKGLLIEEQRTNLTLNSGSAAVFTSQGGTGSLTANATVAPDGTITATQLNNTTSYFGQINFVSAAATNYTQTLYVKQGSGLIGLLIGSTSTTSGGIDGNFNASNGTFTGAGTCIIQSVGNGWWRVGATLLTNLSGTGYLRVSPQGTFCYAWGVQQEAGAFATSYIPTVASQVTRAADSASIIGNNFARWYNQNTGTAFIDYATFASGSITLPVMEFSDGTTSNRTLFQNNPATNSRVLAFVGGSAVVTTLDATAVAQTKVDAAYSVGSWAASYNGATALTNSYAGVVPNQSQLIIGYTTAGGNPRLNGTIKRIAYYNRRLSNTELQGITS